MTYGLWTLHYDHNIYMKHYLLSFILVNLSPLHWVVRIFPNESIIYCPQQHRSGLGWAGLGWTSGHRTGSNMKQTLLAATAAAAMAGLVSAGEGWGGVGTGQVTLAPALQPAPAGGRSWGAAVAGVTCHHALLQPHRPRRPRQRQDQPRQQVPHRAVRPEPGQCLASKNLKWWLCCEPECCSCTA